MRALLQRVSDARVLVSGGVVGSIGQGLLVLLGIRVGDDDGDAEFLARKVVDLRVFEDEQGKMNRSLRESGGAALVVSQFTLFADCRKGRRPFFGDAQRPDAASALCDHFCAAMVELGLVVQTGQFGATMKVELTNDGPVTIMLDTDELTAPRRR